MEISAKTLHFIEEHKEDDTRTLALQSKKYPDVDMAVAVTQIAGRQVAARKLPSWHLVSALWYPPHLSMEQCSSEATALYKASLLEGDTFVDLTGGSALIAVLSPGISSKLIMWRGRRSSVSWLCIISLYWGWGISGYITGMGWLICRKCFR